MNGGGRERRAAVAVEVEVRKSRGVVVLRRRRCGCRSCLGGEVNASVPNPHLSLPFLLLSVGGVCLFVLSPGFFGLRATSSGAAKMFPIFFFVFLVLSVL